MGHTDLRTAENKNKRTYRTPKFTTYGDISILTQNKTQTGLPDSTRPIRTRT